MYLSFLKMIISCKEQYEWFVLRTLRNIMNNVDEEKKSHDVICCEGIRMMVFIAYWDEWHDLQELDAQ